MENKSEELGITIGIGDNGKAEVINTMNVKTPIIHITKEKEPDVLEVDVNGVKYVKIVRNNPKRSNMLNQMMVLGTVLGGLPSDMLSEPSDEYLINLAKKYELVEQKISKESRNQRVAIVYNFNRYFIKK